MSKFSRIVIVLLLLGTPWCLGAAEVTLTLNKLAYPAKDYGPTTPTVEGVGNSRPLDRQATGNACSDSRTGCALILGEVHYRDHLTGLASLLVSNTESGWGSYGTVGAWRWGTLERKHHAQTTCTDLTDCGFVLDKDFEVRHRTVWYAGGGIQYRFNRSHFSVTPSFGVVGHYPRIQSVTGSSHLFQTGLRISFKLSKQTAVSGGYAHLSNGKGLGLAKKGSPNQGIEQFGLGLSYRF